MKSIRTDRFILQRMEEKEYLEFYQLLDGVQADNPPYYVKKAVIECMMLENKYFSIFLKASGEYLGYICLQIIENDICNELGIAIREAYQNRGVATEIIPAFLNWIYNNYDIQTVIVRIEPDNTHSQHLFEKLGATFDGLKERRDPCLLKLNELRRTIGEPEQPLPQVLYYHFDLPLSSHRTTD